MICPSTITITKYNIEENTIAEELYVHLDGPISSIVLQKAENDVHLLVTGSIGFAIEFRNVFANRLKNGKELLTSTTPQDSILCACYADVDLVTIVNVALSLILYRRLALIVYLLAPLIKSFILLRMMVTKGKRCSFWVKF